MVKRILFVSPTGTLDNGAEKSITNLMIYLSENGYQIFNVYPENGHYTHRQYIQSLLKKNIRLYPLQTIKWWWEEAPGELLFSKEERSLFYQYNIKQIRDIIKNEKIDLVISNTVNVFQGSIAAACEKIPHYWLIHEFPDREFAYYKDKINYIFDNSDKVFSVEGGLTETLSELTNQNSKLNSFVPYSHLSNENLIPSDKRRIISIGKINENKNQLELLEAYAKLNRQEIPLVFIGDWEEDIKKQCDAFIKEHSLRNVHFLGFREKPWDEVTDADICVFTSKSEAFSLVFVESVLKGVPSIVSNNKGYQSVSDYFQAGKSYNLNDTDELKDRIVELLDNFDDYKSSSLTIKNNSKKLYTVKNCFHSIISSLESLQENNEKSLAALDSLLGSVIPSHEIFDIKSQYISIFYSKKEEDFTEDHCYKFPFQYMDQIFFQVPMDTGKLRIDLSELPIYLESVNLKTSSDLKQEVFITATNGINTETGLLFDKNDPQILYLIDDVDSTNYVFSYKLKDMFKLMKENSILSEIANLQSKHNQLVSDYQRLSDTYSSIINSKRWKMSSKIINFFRRSK